eukprot:5977576-Lingulodinium_polyedra.AAC.1
MTPRGGRLARPRAGRPDGPTRRAGGPGCGLRARPPAPRRGHRQPLRAELGPAPGGGSGPL